MQKCSSFGSDTKTEISPRQCVLRQLTNYISTPDLVRSEIILSAKLPVTVYETVHSCTIVVNNGGLHLLQMKRNKSAVLLRKSKGSHPMSCMVLVNKVRGYFYSYVSYQFDSIHTPCFLGKPLFHCCQHDAALELQGVCSSRTTGRSRFACLHGSHPTAPLPDTAEINRRKRENKKTLTQLHSFLIKSGDLSFEVDHDEQRCSDTHDAQKGKIFRLRASHKHCRRVKHPY